MAGDRAASMEDKRSSERKLIHQLLRVTDRRSNRTVGNLVNLSMDGFLLISPVPIPPQTVAELSLELPYAVNGRDHVDLVARCIWCQKSSYSDDYGAGYQIEQMSIPDRAVMRAIFGGV